MEREKILLFSVSLRLFICFGRCFQREAASAAERTDSHAFKRTGLGL
ncbi:hypothetical protein EH2_00561 [Bacillus subtilis]|nr:hypothetical protein EH2_00561 [Bacillus subtilis]